MNIAFFETEDWQAEYLKERLKAHKLVFYQALDNLNNPEIDILSNFVAFPITEKNLNSFPKLKYITTRSTGFDHIDLKASEKRGILVSNVPTYGENTVAEFTFALILTLSRKLNQTINRIRQEGNFSTDGLQGFDLKDKTLGVVGTGHIGEHVVRIATGFEMKILAYDPHPKADFAEQYGFEYLSLDDLLKNSDIITLHVPYLPQTHHIINKEKFNLFKKGSILINTARGGLVETMALLAALQDGQLAGAALDVLEEEGFIKEELELLFQKHPNENQLKTVLADHELMKMENVIITPHNAFNTKEAMERILDTTVQNILGFAAGKPINLVK